jgi:hypothetical protein
MKDKKEFRKVDREIIRGEVVRESVIKYLGINYRKKIIKEERKDIGCIINRSNNRINRCVINIEFRNIDTIKEIL